MNKTAKGLPSKRLRELASYVQGFADANHNDKLAEAAEWLRDAAGNICAGGFWGCYGGDKCTSDHK